MFRFPWLAASLAFVVFIFSIEAAATSPPDPYGPILRDCSLKVDPVVELWGCLCGPKNDFIRKLMQICVANDKRSTPEDVRLWNDFKCSTCRNTVYEGKHVYVPRE
ncbi:BZ3500_MvSof-1268-A1-R1_Chr10-1g02654 [Microbotryum saponariae]|uniref:BZ3500_MvSof-1268-A1-R1_Chr10-1g02654 protein n=1 Tax=Microbotryum saponariae TaxID=289078 RepID=A0A2X0N865_9BASI|nr:BZ3500_MvSof-1268-A1-R1_Chr10-1g02654 [Microbotryum saponariae]SDA06143.1 BZ3501_MvSof-1269-A2-R1_Chr10-1g02255 [Microbotryum saponariae]